MKKINFTATKIKCDKMNESITCGKKDFYLLEQF